MVSESGATQGILDGGRGLVEHVEWDPQNVEGCGVRSVDYVWQVVQRIKGSVGESFIPKIKKQRLLHIICYITC